MTLISTTGFDPWNESQKALADLIEKEQGGVSGMGLTQPPLHHHLHNSSASSATHAPGLHAAANPLLAQQQHNNMLLENRLKNLPPGFTPNHLGAFPNHLSEYQIKLVQVA